MSNTLVFSPTDLCRYVASPFASWMDRYAVERPGEVVIAPPSEEQRLLRRKGREHEARYHEALIAAGHTTYDGSDEDDRLQATSDAMHRGEALIWQGALRRLPFQGCADLLVQVEGSSGLGDFHYIPRDVKLGLSAKPQYILQVCAYADMLEAFQGQRPEILQLLLGNGELVEVRTADSFHYYVEQRAAFLEFQRNFDPENRPVPELNADHGGWNEEAEQYLEEIDHLSRVANIRRSQIKRLEAAGISTLKSLAQSTADRIPRLNPSTFERLRRQARLQLQSQGSDRPAYEVVVPDEDAPPRGLALLPPASSNDLFFDMEGDPMIEGGLEYLFGLALREHGKPAFRDWWAHTRDEEKQAFEGFMDWAHARWRLDPTLHIYHYNHYETTALKRLAATHATREAALDQLLRHEAFIDLYAVARHGVCIGEPSYSLKNLERLYRPARSGEVTSAAGSIAEYERFRASGEPPDWRRSPTLESIRRYNQDDCESTAMLADWLRGRQREHRIAYRGKKVEDDPTDPEGEPNEGHRRRRALAERLLEETDPVGRLLGQLVEFHRREEKPTWWEVFRRHAMTDEELAEDLACLGLLQRIDGSECRIRQSTGIRYRFDADQDTKLDDGDDFYLACDLELRGKIETIDRNAGEVLLVFSPKMLAHESWPPPPRLSLIPRELVPAEILQVSLEDLARGWLDGHFLPGALRDFLHRARPRLEGHEGGPIIRKDETPVDGCIRVVPRMLDTTLSIQGPPGTGKTYTAARIVLDLLGRGKRIGITSNSHKAILNLLAKCAELNGADLRCLKVGGDEHEPLLRENPGSCWVKGGREAAAESRGFALVGGTAWLFSRLDLRGAFDYLFVDEAGQVAVANLVAMAGAARNLVLIGDQMQLGQPIQARHPDRSGESTLEYLLQDQTTIPPDRGIFLDVTYRLHPEICSVNSQAFYGGKLRSAASCVHRRILLREGDTGLLNAESGVVFVPVVHEGNTQGSDEEAGVVRELFDRLLGSEFTDSRGEVAGRLALGDVLVVAPYNMQVRKLRDRLPQGARVGSVDKFQGQEAPVVIVSMCASEAFDSPRGIDFLLSPNRLNVAISRARSLAIIVGHPGLARVNCRTSRQLQLLNLYARLVQKLS